MKAIETVLGRTVVLFGLVTLVAANGVGAPVEKNGGVVSVSKAVAPLAEATKNGGVVAVTGATDGTSAQVVPKVQRTYGDRVRAVVNNPDGSTCILVGHTGTVICDDSSDSLPLLVQWDNNDSCTFSQSGCSRTALHAWWVNYSDVVLDSPARYQYGDRVRAVVNNPSESTCIMAGDMGTVYCDDEASDVLPLLVNWDSNDACTFAQSGCSLTAPHGWWVQYEEVVKVSGTWDAGYTDLGDDWRRLAWFGDYIPMGAGGWVWHGAHGALYIPAGTMPHDIWMYSMDMGWLWTANTTYPFLYRYIDGAWLWYNGSVNPRWFVNMATGQWESRP